MLDLVVEFLHVLKSNIPSIENGDHMGWMLKKNGEFDICLYYNELWGPFSIVFPWKGIWRVKAPQQVSPSCFVWTTAWDKILTVKIWEVGLSLLWTGVSCAIIVGRLWIIYYFIVRRLISCGVLSLDLLVFRGSYQVWYQIFFSVGEALVRHLEFSSVVFDVVCIERT